MNLNKIKRIMKSESFKSDVMAFDLGAMLAVTIACQQNIIPTSVWLGSMAGLGAVFALTLKKSKESKKELECEK